MNKFSGPSDPDYTKVAEIILRVLEKIQTGSLLAQADAWICEKHYDKQKLEIVRLSGETLDMDHCYINLALVETRQAGISKGFVKDATLQSPTFSLAERLKVETPHKDLRVELPNLFQPRKLPDGNRMKPRRILIRGRAGVGKTTLCKKMAHDFVHKGMWRDLFKRLLWIQLRDLKDLPENDNDLGGMLKHIFFQQHVNKRSLSDELRHHIEDPEAPDTLFLLDGLDEIPEIVMEHHHRGPHRGHELLKELFERSNLIITTRPHAALPKGFATPDLELDTMGFIPDQVQSYLETVIPRDKDTIQAYLRKNPIMQSLVHIPILLDALCYTWQSRSTSNDGPKHIPETMTTVYEDTATELWKKDNDRLGGKLSPRIWNSCTSETEPFESTEYNNLGYLAFSGLYSNVVEFQPNYRKALYQRMKAGKFRFDDTFARLSFLRTSDPSKTRESQSFHFIHLTFQEYFSAKYFVKAWKDTQTLEYTEFRDGKPETGEISCHGFFQKHKYAARYNIMWRFVAGLLDAKGEIASFFGAVESEPIDLFGPTHQRLVMHCLAEVIKSSDIRTKLERQLSQWLHFEYKFQDKPLLIREAELPERALNLVLEEASEEVKMTILKSFLWRASLPIKTIELVTPWLEEQNVSQELQLATLSMLRFQHESLPRRTFNALTKCMGDDDPETREAAMMAFYSQKTWPEDILEAEIARLEIQDVRTKLEAALALQDQSALPENVVRRLEDESTRGAAFAVCNRQSKLTNGTIQAIGAHFGNSDDVFKAGAFKVLKDQPGLPSDVLDHMAAWLEGQDDASEDEFRHGNHEHHLSNDLFLAVLRRVKNQGTHIRRKALRVLQCGIRRHLLKACSDDVVQVIVSWLGDQDTGSRLMALQVLKLEHDLPKDVLSAVLAHLETSDRELQRRVFEVLRNQSVLSPDVFQVMEKWLESQDKGVQKMASEVLSGSQILPEGVLEAVVAQLEDQDGSVRVAALKVFTGQNRQQDFADDVLRAVVAQLDYGDCAVREEALRALENLGHRQALPDDVLNAALAQLRSQDKNIQKAALSIFEELGSHQYIQPHVVQAIAAKLEEQNEDVRYTALKALRALGGRQTFPGDVVEAVAARLDDEDPDCRSSALKALSHQSELPENILQAMVVKPLQDEMWRIRCQALRIVKERQTLPEDILGAIAAQLGHEEYAVRREACITLASRTALSENILSAVMARLGDQDSAVRHEAIKALGSQTKLPERVLEAMLACADDPKSHVRWTVMEALQNQSGLSEPFFKAVTPWMEDEDPRVRQQAVKLLGTNPTLPDKVLHAVTTRLSDKADRVRWAVLKALAGQRTLPDTILTSPGFYPLWLAICFEQPLCCYIEDGVSYLEMPAGLGKVRLEGDPDEFRAAMRERQRELGVPV